MSGLHEGPRLEERMKNIAVEVQGYRADPQVAM